MGADIHSFVEVYKDGAWHFDGPRFKNWNNELKDGPFADRSYFAFGFLAGVRNYSVVTPIAEPRGVPGDASDYVKEEYEKWGIDAHTPSWLSLKELLNFDYDAEMEDRRCDKIMPGGGIDGGATCEPGEGKKKSYREFLGQGFFKDLEVLQKSENIDNTRIVFWFDN